MKFSKILAVLLAVVMVFAMVACKSEKASVDAESVPDTMTSSDGKYEIAFVTDVGQL